MLGSYAYVAGAQQLLVVNIGDPRKPILQGAFSQDGIFSVEAAQNRVYVVYNAYQPGNMIICCERYGGFKILDISNPSSPTLVGRYPLSGGAWVTAMKIANQRAFIAYQGVIFVLDLSNPLSPTLLGTFNASDLIYEMTLVGTRLYLAKETGVQIVDVSATSAFTPLGSYRPLLYISDLYASGSTLYVADWSQGLFVIDATDPRRPLIAGEIALTSARKVKVSNARAYILAEDALYIIDVTHPATMAILSRLSVTPGGIYGLDVVGDLVYAIDGAGFHIFDAHNPSAPVALGVYRNAFGNIHVYGKYAYISDGASGFIDTLDVSNPTSPQYIPSNYAGSTIFEAVFEGSIAYGVGAGGMTIIDLSNPAQPVILGRYYAGHYSLLGPSHTAYLPTLARNGR